MKKNRSGYTVLMIAMGGLMTALEIVMERYMFIGNDVTRYSPAFVARAISGSLFGPAFTALIGLVADYVGATIRYGSSNILLSITAVMRGFFYGLFLKDKIDLKRVVAAVLSVEILCSLCLNTVILHFMYKMPLKATLLARLPQAGIYILIQIPVIMTMGKYLIPQLRKILRSYGGENADDLVQKTITPGSRPGLERVRTFSRILGNPEKSLRIIQVAGTNGKGSISGMLSEILKASGMKVGLFNSPYLSTPREYFNINGKLISGDDFDLLAKELTGRLEEGLEGAEAPTEFEFYTCAALKYFADNKCDIVILEAGMGGEKDATNYVNAPELAVIANIGMDHEAYLGNTIEEIAEQKAGIIKKGCSAVLYPSAEPALEVLKKKCDGQDVKYAVPDFSRLNTYMVFGDSCSSTLTYTTGKGEAFEAVIRSCAGYQARNAATVLEAVSVLRERGFIISDEAVVKGLEAFKLPARFEILQKDPLVIADGGHNPQCAEAVVEAVKGIAADKKIIVLTSVMKDKAYRQIYDIINGIAAEYIAVAADNPRALPAEDLAEFLAGYGKPAAKAESVAEGVKLAKKRLSELDDPCLLITGTFYMMDSVRAEFGK